MEAIKLRVVSVEGVRKRTSLPFQHRKVFVDVTLLTGFSAVVSTQRTNSRNETERPDSWSFYFDDNALVFEVPGITVEHALSLRFTVRKSSKKMLGEVKVGLAHCLKAEAIECPLSPGSNDDDFVVLKSEDVWKKSAVMAGSAAQPAPVAVTTPRALELMKKGRHRGILNILIEREVAPVYPVSSEQKIEIPKTIAELREERKRRSSLSKGFAMANRRYDPSEPPVTPRIEGMVFLDSDSLELLAAQSSGGKQRWADCVLAQRESLATTREIHLFRPHLDYLLKNGPDAAKNPECEIVILEGLLTLRPEPIVARVDLSSRLPETIIPPIFFVSWKRHWFVLTDRRVMMYECEEVVGDKWRKARGWFTRGEVLGSCPVYPSACAGWHCRVGVRDPFLAQSRDLADIVGIREVQGIDTHSSTEGVNEARYAWEINFKDGGHWIVRTHDLEIFNTWTSIMLVLIHARAVKEEPKPLYCL